MLRKLPGIDIPVATEARILQAAAFLEFKQHVESAAHICWMHAVEVVDSPVVMPTTTECEFMPPFFKLPP